jgi:hypothetical protein
MDELDRDTAGERRIPPARGEEDEERSQPLPSGGERLDPDAADEAGRGAGDGLEPGLQLREVGCEPRGLADRGERVQRATPVWSATIPPPRRRNPTSAKPASPRRRASSSGPGKRRTDAGRYV